MYITLIV